MAAVVVLGLGGTALGASSGNVGECSAKANFGCSSWEGGDRLNCNDPNKGIMDWVARPVRSDNYVVEVDREDYVRVPGEYLDVSRANRCRPPRRSGRLWSTTLRATFTTTTRRQDRRSGSVRWGRASKFCENSFHICSSLPSHLVSSPKDTRSGKLCHIHVLGRDTREVAHDELPGPGSVLCAALLLRGHDLAQLYGAGRDRVEEGQVAKLPALLE